MRDEEPFSEETDAKQLQYRSGADDLSSIRVNIVAATAMGVAVTLVGLIAIMIFMAFSMDYRGFNQQQGYTGQTIAWVTIVLVLGSLVLLAMRCQKRAESRSRALGIWIGMGAAFLIEGMCFVYNTR